MTVADAIARVAEEVGIALEPGQVALLAQFRRWLIAEAAVAGGIGPNEAASIDDRHLADGLLYMIGAPTATTILDLGSGVGLPGLVLAIARPEAAVRLLDRSGRRCELAARAVRVLGLSNVTVDQADFERSVVEPAELVTMRAALPPRRAIPLMASLATRSAALGISRREAAPDTSELVDLATSSGMTAEIICSTVLDPPAWMLIMAPQ